MFQALTLRQGMTMTNIHSDTQNFTFETLHGGQLTLSTQLTILNTWLYSPTDAKPHFL